MISRSFPVREEYPFGGPGQFILGTVQAAAQQLIRDYEGKVDLIYLDPPLEANDFISVKLPGVREKLKIPAYSDGLDRLGQLDMLKGVFELCYALLKDSGSLYVHTDSRASARIRLILDDIFGEELFQNEIIWAYKSSGRSTRQYSKKHDNILFYKKTSKSFFDITAVGIPRGPMKRNNMKRTVDENGRLCFSIRSGGKTYTYYEDTPIYPTDVWADIEYMHQRDPERTGYSTQKPEALLRRIISASCPEGGLVADLFSGSGTTAAVAAKLNRRFLAVDASSAALGVTRKRLLSAGHEASLIKESAQLSLCYPACPAGDIQAEISFSQDAFGKYASIDSFSCKYGLAFMAFGRTDDCGTFRAAEYTLFPAVGSRLSDSSRKADTVQLCDNAGSMVFYTAKD